MARIIVADDEQGLRTFVAEALEADGHVVAQAADGAQAAERLARESFDLLITDLKMPRMDGMALLRQARLEQPEMEVIVVTAHGSVDSAVEAMKLGAFDYLEKPIAGPSQLRLLVTRALERRQLLAARDRAVREAPALPPLTWGDPAMASVVETLRKVARTDASVLLLGESGTGKEVAARTLHAWSARAQRPFVAVNCASIPETLLESELFGHEKGAFTGASSAHRGRIELAEGGTFFLDEIGEMTPGLQAKLLRVLEDRRYERVGGTRTLEADVRWIAATNRDVETLRKVARTDASVLLLGESGTGKEVAARTLHAWSARAQKPFVAVNCASIPETLLESELFGHEKGAFTGASAARRGRIELAEGGTFFLDEIGEMTPALQAKLLRVLEDRRYERVGGTRTLEADVRWVAATNRDIETLRATGALREDLYHRLAGIPIRLPPLRERRRDIEPLAEILLARIGAALGRTRLCLSPDARQRILEARWPGNVRELDNVLERAAILAEGDEIRAEHLELGDGALASGERGGWSGAAPAESAGAGAFNPARTAPATLEEIEREAIEDALAASGGNRRAAADRLGIGLRTLYDKLKKYRGGVEEE